MKVGGYVDLSIVNSIPAKGTTVQGADSGMNVTASRRHGQGFCDRTSL
jgi:hypothetical protein